MKHSTVLAAMVFAASAAAAAQQTPQSTTPAAPQSSTPQTNSQPARPASSEQRSVTVAGCLKPIEAPGSVASTTASSPQFTLSNARVVPSAAGAATTAPPAAAAGSASFAVIAENVEELRGQANHQVEITGRLEPMPAAPASGAVGTSGTTGAAPSMRLRVDSVKQLAATCPSN